MNVNSKKRTFNNNNEYFTDRGSCPEKNPLLLGEGTFPLPRTLSPLWRPIEQELQTIFEQLEAALRPLGRSLLKELMQQLPDYEFLFPPGLVCFSGHLFSQGRDQYLPALFMELLYLGTRYHNMAGHLKSKEQQMFVLTGDFLYSHLFYLLDKSQNLFLLDNFSRLIIAMNEGFASEEGYRLKKTKPDKKEIREWLYKQYGVFYGESCFLGSLFARSSKKEQLIMKEFGTAFGIAYGIHKKGYSSLSADEFMEKGFSALSLLPDSQGKKELESFVLGIIESGGI